jgi:serpin B
MKAVVAGNNAFATNLYAQLSKRPGNLFFSPDSISAALAMTYAGARGETAEEMASTLHFTLDQQQLLAAYGGLMRQMNANGKNRGYQFAIANALWGQKGYGFLEGFLRTTHENFGAGLREVDFATASEEARRTVNQWVENQTNRKIKDLLAPGSVNAATRLVLTNAIYFKADWVMPFAKNRTKKEAFLLPGGGQVGIGMMHKNEELRYFEAPDFQVLELPYQGRDLAMIVFLPKKVDGLAEFEKQFSASEMQTWLGKLSRYQVDVAVPKFQLTEEFQLKQTLSALGMPLAFTAGKADFSGMSTHENLYLDEVVHKAFVDVNEEGTEAAAATGVVVRTLAARVVPKATFRADHPFVFVIRNHKTGSIVFMGRMANPNSEAGRFERDRYLRSNECS